MQPVFVPLHFRCFLWQTGQADLPLPPFLFLSPPVDAPEAEAPSMPKAGHQPAGVIIWAVWSLTQRTNQGSPNCAAAVWFGLVWLNDFSIAVLSDKAVACKDAMSQQGLQISD